MLELIEIRKKRKIEHIFELYNKYSKQSKNERVYSGEPPDGLKAKKPKTAITPTAILYNQNRFFNLTFAIPFDSRFNRLTEERFTSYFQKVQEKAEAEAEKAKKTK